MPQLGALGLAGGAGGVEDDGGVVVARPRPCRRSAAGRAMPCPSVSVPSIGDAAAGSTVIMKKCSQPSVCSKPACPSCADRQLGGALEAEVGLRLGVGQVVGDLAPLEQHVERHDGRAGLEDPVVDDREVRQVRAAQRHLVAGLDPARDQQVGDLVGGAVDLRVGQAGVAEDDGLAVGVRRRRSPRAGRRGWACAPTYPAVVTRHGHAVRSTAAAEDPGALRRSAPIASRPAVRRRPRAAAYGPAR